MLVYQININIATKYYRWNIYNLMKKINFNFINKTNNKDTLLMITLLKN